MKSLLQLIPCLAVSLVVLGCGGSSERKGTVDDPGKGAIEDFAQFLKNLPADGKKPPTKMAEFIPLEPMAPVAGEFLKNGSLVYFWGNGIGSGSTIIAHEKKVPTEGGWVLLQDGTVKKMSADEFKTAPKAKQ
jgi:hypothetical protein